MINKRYGYCKSKHAEVTIKSGIRSSLRDYNINSDGASRSKKEIEEIVKEHFEVIAQGNGEDACELANCMRGVND